MVRKSKVPKLSIPVPAHIVLLPNSTMYFNSHNSDRIPAGSLYKYLTGKDPAPEKPKKARQTKTKDEFIRSRRWDLEKD